MYKIIVAWEYDFGKKGFFFVLVLVSDKKGIPITN